MNPESRKFAAFLTLRGFREWARFPFGLMNAPPYFQRFMEKCLEGYHDNFVNPYLDDLLNFSAPFDENLNHQKLVFKRLRKNAIRIKARMCQFF